MEGKLDKSVDSYLSSREGERLLYHLVSEDPEMALLEQKITFLGCSMELLRSSLAAWVQNNPNSSESIWSPLVEGNGSETHKKFTNCASDSFTKCIRGEKWSSRVGCRLVQMRLLWELQNYFHGLIPEEGLSPERHKATILYILSFPAVEFSFLDDDSTLR